jgi:hypothetical protein
MDEPKGSEPARADERLGAVRVPSQRAAWLLLAIG